MSDLDLTYLLIGVAAVAGLLGLGMLVRRRALGPLLYIGTSLLALWYVRRTGSPWADAKALAIASPAVLLVAAHGAVALDELGARLSAVLVAAALAGGVIVSNAKAYHEVSNAPRERLAELSRIGELTDGHGPTLYTEFEEFAKHFLRDAQPVGASEGFRVPGLSPKLRGGAIPRFGFGTPVDRLALRDVSRFRTLVIRRSPLDAPPPADFRRTWSGHYYEVWRRREDLRVRKHVPLRTLSAACSRVHRLALEADGGQYLLVGAERPLTNRFSPAASALPAGWTVRTDDPMLVETRGPGAVAGTLGVPRTGSYEVWLAGSVGRRLGVSFDGREVGSVEDELSRPPGWLLLGTTDLRRGPHRVRIVRGGGNLEPGNGDGPRFVGPVVVRPASGAARLRSVAARIVAKPVWPVAVVGGARGQVSAQTTSARL